MAQIYADQGTYPAYKDPKRKKTFDVEDLTASEPFGQFQHWLQDAVRLEGIEGNCMAVATATKDGIPSVRMVSMTSFSKEGFNFFTNYNSRKAKELRENPLCSLMFYWESLKRSVRIEGKVVHVPEEESEKYFNSQSHEHQIRALVSKQSSVIANREILDKMKEEMALKYLDESKPVPKPESWGGYRVIPTSFEFWYGHPDRLHDRLRFRRPRSGDSIDKTLTQEVEDGWLLERLSP